MYAGLIWETNPGEADSPTGGAVLKTSDGGNTWHRLDLNEGVTALVLDAENPGVVFAGTADHGVFESTDAGGSWNSLDQGLTDQRVRALAISADGQTLYAGTAGGVFVLRR